MKHYIAALLFLVLGFARAGEKGGIAFILDHGKELNLNDDQKRKLNNMRTVEERTRNKILAEADTKVIVHKWLEGVRKKDEAAAGLAFTELTEMIVKKSEPVAKTMMNDLSKTLTSEQILKVNQLKEDEDAKKKPVNPLTGKKDKDEPNKPRRGTEPPNPFDF